jgi:hypothetical protein
VAESESETGTTVPAEIVQASPGQVPTWEKGLFAVVMVSSILFVPMLGLNWVTHLFQLLNLKIFKL